MNSPDELRQEIAALRERISMLQRGHPAHQRKPRPRNRPARGRRQRPRADRGTLRDDHDRRRTRRDPGVHRPRPHAGGAPAHRPVAARVPVLRTPPGPSGRAAPGGPSRPRPLARLFRGADAVEDPAGHADTPPRGACRQLLSRREGGRAGVHGRGRGDPSAVRLAGGDGDRQRPRAPRRAAGPGRPGGPGRQLAGRGGGLRCQERPAGVVQPRGEADRRGTAQWGQPNGATARGHDLPARRRARDPAWRAPAHRRAAQCRDGARGGDRTLGPRRAQRHHAGQRHPDPFGGRRGRADGGHPAGPGAARGAGAPARGVPGHGEPRVARAADFHQGFGRHRADRLAGARPGRDARVLPHHRRAGRSHARPRRRPARCRTHRHGHPLGTPRTVGGRGPGRPGQEHLHQRRRPPRRADRPAARPAACDGRPAAHRPGAEQPVLQRLAARPGSHRPSGSRRCTRAFTSPSPSPTRARA